MEKWAPNWTAESWDNAGLLAGDPGWEVTRALVALELTPELLSQAIDSGAQMILTHHPPLFKPLKSLRLDNQATARIIKAVSSGIALYAAHTNLDAAPLGVNDALADLLGLVDTDILDPAASESQLKLTVFVPPSHQELVAEALFSAGAGVIGNYSRCSFAAQGHGSYLAPPDGRPYAGGAGQEHTAPEIRLEMILPKAAADKAVAALMAAHPYEEPAYDLYPVIQPPSGFGIGKIGRLPTPQSGNAFLATAAKVLNADNAQVCGPIPQTLEKVAVVGGSGGDFLAQAAAAGAQMLITGEARYHAADQANDLGICLACFGHFETENVIIEPWAQHLSKMLTNRGFSCDIQACVDGNSPWRPVR